MKKLIVWCIGAVVAVVFVATVGGSFYMLEYSLVPENNRAIIDSCYREQFRTYPESIKDIRFIDDCGYTSVWDEFAGELKNQFGLPEFPLMYSTSLLCKLRYGWSFGEASAISEVSKSSYPMLFIHGGSDTFVPTEMVYRLYEAKPDRKIVNRTFPPIITTTDLTDETDIKYHTESASCS